MRIVWSSPTFRKAYEAKIIIYFVVVTETVWKLTANGSACSQLIGAPQELGRTFSGRLSGTATKIKNTSSTAIAVAKATINVSLYTSRRYAPNAGEMTCKVWRLDTMIDLGLVGKLTRLAAKVAETKPYAFDRSSVVVTSATYAKTTENVTANTPLIEIIAKNHLQRIEYALNFISKIECNTNNLKASYVLYCSLSLYIIKYTILYVQTFFKFSHNSYSECPTLPLTYYRTFNPNQLQNKIGIKNTAHSMTIEITLISKVNHAICLFRPIFRFYHAKVTCITNTHDTIRWKKLEANLLTYIIPETLPNDIELKKLKKTVQNVTHVRNSTGT